MLPQKQPEQHTTQHTLLIIHCPSVFGFAKGLRMAGDTSETPASCTATIQNYQEVHEQERQAGQLKQDQ